MPGHTHCDLLSLFPGISVSVNGPGRQSLSSDALFAILYHVSDNLLGYSPWLDTTNTCYFPVRTQSADVHTTDFATVNNKTKNLQSLQEYTGTYGNVFVPVLMYIYTKMFGNSAKLLFTMGRFGGEMVPAGEEDCFYIEITWPWEMRESFTDTNNVTMAISSQFHRHEAAIDSLTIDGAINIRYKKNYHEQARSHLNDDRNRPTAFNISQTYHLSINQTKTGDNDVDVSNDTNVNQTDCNSGNQSYETSLNQSGETNLNQTDDVIMKRNNETNIHHIVGANERQPDEINMSQTERTDTIDTNDSEFDQTYQNQSDEPNMNHSFNINVNQSDEPNMNHSYNINVNQSDEPNMNQSYNIHVNQSDEPNMNQSYNINVNQSDIHNLNYSYNINTNQNNNSSLNRSLETSVNETNVGSVNRTNTNETHGLDIKQTHEPHSDQIQESNDSQTNFPGINPPLKSQISALQNVSIPSGSVCLYDCMRIVLTLHIVLVFMFSIS